MKKHRKRENTQAERAAHYRSMGVNDRLIFKLRDLNHTMRMLYEGRGSQTNILISLLMLGPVTQRDLTEQLGIQPGSASEVIGKLESAGLIAREPSPSDRRTSVISLTPPGRTRAQEAVEQRCRRHEEMFIILSEEEKLSLLALLEKLADDWDSRYWER